MIKFALLGAGRIGTMHAEIITASPQAQLSYVFDTHLPSAVALANKLGTNVAESIDTILEDNDVDALLIATSTDTHVDFIIKGAKAGKAILCEKPIDLSTERVLECWQQIKEYNVPIQIGFNRRFDPTHAGLQKKVANGEIGELQQLILTSRDPDIAPLDYLRHSGGMFRDMMIHDFDMLRFIVNEEVTELHAIGSTLIEPGLKEMGDVDSVMITLTTQSGKLCHINGSRRCVYGYDQRVEAFGAKGMVQSNNPRPNAISLSTSTATNSLTALNPFFIERYQEAYQIQLNSFLCSITNKKMPSPSFKDGLYAQIMADAAQESINSGKPIKLDYERLL